MSYTNSKTWVAPEAAEKERWTVVLANLERMTLVPRSPFVPHDYSAWLAHRVAWLQCQSQANLVTANLQAERKANIKAGLISGIGPAFGGKIFNDNRGAVLAVETIWCVRYQPTEIRPSAPWPSMEEMKEEGDERNTSGYKRFPALPRVPGNETVVWKQKAMIDSYPLDRVWELPTAGHLETPSVDEIITDFLGNDLLDAIDYEDVPSQRDDELRMDRLYEDYTSDNELLNFSTQDVYSSHVDVGPYQNAASGFKLDDYSLDDFEPGELLPYDTSGNNLKRPSQRRKQIELKDNQETHIDGEGGDEVPCDVLQSVENSWTVACA
ncbi:hypothetical protein MMC08_000226 [Hypocenomyce scalaris]|nr:hypothetical protein [Hypocenomyce scalaris]